MMKGGTLLILDHEVKFQGMQLWPPARGRHALRCLVHFLVQYSNTATFSSWYSCVGFRLTV